jgi:hypothetical protein
MNDSNSQLSQLTPEPGCSLDDTVDQNDPVECGSELNDSSVSKEEQVGKNEGPEEELSPEEESLRLARALAAEEVRQNIKSISLYYCPSNSQLIFLCSLDSYVNQGNSYVHASFKCAKQ